MVESKIEISEIEYLEYIDKSHSEINNFIESKLPIEIICGYGFYGGKLIIENNKYYIKYMRGSSCD